VADNRLEKPMPTSPSAQRIADDVLVDLALQDGGAHGAFTWGVLAQFAQPGDTEGAKWAGMRIHMVPNKAMIDLGYSSKLNAEWEFLTMLRDEGRSAAETFLTAHAGDLGKRSSIDLDVLLEGV
jgi:hypothetical protein